MEDLRLVLAATSDGPVDLLGFSWGAHLAMLHTALYPESVRTLTLVSPPPIAPEDMLAMSERIRAAEARPEVAEFAASVRNGEANVALTRHRVRVASFFDVPARAMSVDLDLPRPNVVEAVSRSLRDLDVDWMLDALVGVPGFVVHGASDPIPQSASARLATRIGAEICLISAAGHAPFVEAPDAFVEAIAGFLSGSRDELTQ